jgi:hypothetical protein
VSTRLRLVIAALLALGVVGFVLAAVVGGDSGDDVSISGNEAIDAVIPSRDSEVLQQQTVGIDLAAGYRLTSLVIAPTNNRSAGVDVTAEVEERAGVNLFQFSPSEGRLIEALSPDINCVFATYVEAARPDQPLTFDWCFEVS